MKFSVRAFISLLLTFLFIGLVLSGGMLYIAPQCWAAEIGGWSVLGWSKPQWQSVHMMTAVLFIGVTAVHLIWFNGKVLLNYFRSRKTDTKRRWSVIRPEVVVAFVVSSAMIGGAVSLVGPFRWLPETHDALQQEYRETLDQSGRGRGQGRAWAQPKRDQAREGRRERISGE